MSRARDNVNARSKTNGKLRFLFSFHIRVFVPIHQTHFSKLDFRDGLKLLQPYASFNVVYGFVKRRYPLTFSLFFRKHK